MSVTLFDSLIDNGGTTTPSATMWFAAKFGNTSATNYSLDSITLGLLNTNFFTISNVTIGLYSVNDGSPGTLIANSNPVDVNNGQYNINFTFTPQPTISGNTEYYVVHSNPNISWVNSDNGAYVVRTLNSGGDWTPRFNLLTLKVEATEQAQAPAPAPAPAPGSTGAPFGITGGYVSSEILAKANASTFQFVDPQTTHMQEAAIYFTNSVGPLSLGTLSASGPQVKVLQAPTNYRYIFSSYSDATKNSLGLNSKTAAFVLKVIDGSGVVQNSISPALNLELYLDVSGGSVVNLDINGTSAGAGTYTRMEGSKFVYTTTFTNGSGAVGATVIPSNPSAGSDPHITTIFGRRYDFHPSTRRTYTLFKSNDMKVSSHFTGLKSGVYYDKVMIDLPNKQQVKVDFNKQTIKGKSSQVSMAKETPKDFQYKNITSDKSVGKFFAPKAMTKLSVAGKNPVDLFVDFDTRYVHFRFPETLPVPSEMSGLIVEPATRLD